MSTAFPKMPLSDTRSRKDLLFNAIQAANGEPITKLCPCSTLSEKDLLYNLITAIEEGGGGGTAPVNVTPPSIAGTPAIGEILTRTEGTYTGAPTIVITGNWQHDQGTGTWLNISGQTGATYDVESDYVGEMIKFREAATNAGGTSYAASNALGPVTEVELPTLVSATVPAMGTTLVLVFSEVVEIGVGGNAGWAITPSGGAATLTYASGDGTNTLVYSLSRTILEDETATVDYTQPGNGIENGDGEDLASINDAAVVNDSEEAASTVNFVNEDFEGDDWPVGWDSEAQMHETTSPIAGAQGLRLLGTGPVAYKVLSMKSSGTEFVMDFQFRYDTVGANSILTMYTSGFATLLNVFILAGGELQINSGGISDNTVATTAVDTIYWCRIRWGSNAHAEIYFSTTSTIPPQGDANFYAGHASTGAATGTPDLMLISSTGSVLDVDTVQITTVATPRVVVCDGDSITAGSEPTDSWPIQLQASVGTTDYRVFNAGVSAQTLDMMLADQDGNYLRYAPCWALNGKPILIVWEYYNQAAVSSAVDVESKIAAVCAAGQAVGFYVIVGTDFHYDANTSTQAGKCRVASDLVRTNYATYADALAELDLPSLRADATTFGDDVHLTPAGWAIVAGVIDDLVLAAP